MSRSWPLALLLSSLLAAPAAADPCGMVPPISVGPDVPLARVGLQKTYVFYADGMETFVIRPGFTGKVEDFGMLIPFPTPPAVRKVADNIFAHVEAAIDPPEVVVDLRPRVLEKARRFSGARPTSSAAPGLSVHEVRVLRQEAVGMYEVAVLEAGSAAALKRWMDDHRYKYPTGMDKVCEEYVGLGWCFVAVKTHVGPKGAVDPQPGMRKVNPGLPPGASFDGNVQAMGFRFHVDELIVPMRLSAFNEGELRNVVYLLTDGPKRIRSIPEEYVVRQISGAELYRNVTGPLPLRVIGGTEADIPAGRRQSLAAQRNPAPHNGLARELFASDLLAIRQNRLSHPHEEDEKVLLRIGERFGLRGPAIDQLNNDALKQDREAALADALDDLKRMTLTVVDGDFPREVLSAKNLKFAAYKMPARRNNAATYDAGQHGPGPRKEGTVTRERLGAAPRPAGGRALGWTLGGLVSLGLLLTWRAGRRRK